MKAVQELVAYFDKRGELSSRQLKRLLDKNYIASEAPSSMHGLCDTMGATYYFRVTGTTEGQIWGTDVYTRDSTLGAKIPVAYSPASTSATRMFQRSTSWRRASVAPSTANLLAV